MAGLTTEIGVAGISIQGGQVLEPVPALRELSGLRGRRLFAEMAEEDATVGVCVAAIVLVILGVKWRVDPADDSPAAADEAAFVEGVLFEDMSHTWPDALHDIMTMVVYGFAALEIVWKRRVGPLEADPTRRSKFDDGRIGLRKLAGRHPLTVYGWETDDAGGVQALIQQPPTGTLITIPIERLLLFRTSRNFGNPEGKALDPETPIPTPDGWRRLDDLHEGDKVFDEQGRIRYVLARADWQDRPCYRVTFNDGTEIVADAEHEWWCQNYPERHGLKKATHGIRTTAELARKVKTKGGVKNYSIPWARPLDYPAQAFLIEPYLLGLWLGDGSSNGAAISSHVDDVEYQREQIHAAGYSTAVVKLPNHGAKGCLVRVYGRKKWDSEGPTAALRLLGLFNNKHIPEAYLRGSMEQRLALLAGLMDSDGTVDIYGRCEFVNNNLNLVTGVCELARSLGVSAVWSLRKRAIAGVRQDSYCCKFTPSFVPFRLPRKAERIRIARAYPHHYVASVEPVENRRTVCIEVDGPSHLFLAGEGLVPTHNSLLVSSRRPWAEKKHIGSLEVTGIDRDLTGTPKLTAPAEVLAAATPEDAARLAAAKQLVENIKAGRQTGVILSSEPYRDADGKPTGAPLWDFSTIGTPGNRPVDIDKAQSRRTGEIMTAFFTQFLLLGSGSRGGNRALSEDQSDFFMQSIGWLLSVVKETVNRHLLPRLWALNGIDPALMPALEHDQVAPHDLAKLGAYVQALAASGAPVGGDTEAVNYLRRAAGMPEEQIDDPRAGADLPGPDDPPEDAADVVA